MALQDRQLGQTKFELVINVKTLALASWLRLFAIADEMINGGGRGCLLSAQSGHPDALNQCLLSAQSGHPDALNQCPLSGAKRTFGGLVAMSAYDPKWKFRGLRVKLGRRTLANEKMVNRVGRHKCGV